MDFKYAIGFIGSIFYRLLHVFPNSDPIMGFVAPAAKKGNVAKAAVFAFANMLIFDLITQKFGIWSIVTASTYALVAVILFFYLRHKKGTIFNYSKACLAGILFFDAITGPIMSMLIFGEPLAIVTIMQIPFTIMHLVSAQFAMLVLVPFLDREVALEMKAIYFSASARMKMLLVRS